MAWFCCSSIRGDSSYCGDARRESLAVPMFLVASGVWSLLDSLHLLQIVYSVPSEGCIPTTIKKYPSLDWLLFLQQARLTLPENLAVSRIFLL